MWGYGPGDWFDRIGHVVAAIGSVFFGVLLFVVWLAIIILLVRFLLIATRAAKVYLRNHGEHDGVLPQRAAAPATTVAPAATTTTTRTRTPKAP